jgi:hypothetical protein
MMEYFIKGTPISIVKHADISIEVACDIYPIHIRHKEALLKYFEKDSFFEYGKIAFISYGYSITTIKYIFDNGWVDIGSHAYEVEDKINDVVDCYMSEYGGYQQIKA